MVSVLLIDRDKTRLAATAAVLARCGYCALSARGDDEALALLDQVPVQVALIAGTAGDLEGASLAETLRRRFPALPVATLRAPVAPALVLHAVGRCLQRDLAA